MKKYIKTKDRRSGLKPSKRPVKDVATGNQWTLTPRQIDFAQRYFTPGSETYANAYQSAIQAGYSPHTAINIVSDSTNNEWITDARRMLTIYKPEHIQQAYQREYEQATTVKDRLHALDSMSKVLGMHNSNNTTEINVNFTNTIPRPNTTNKDIIDQ